MKKQELRKKYKQLRNELTAHQISEWSLDISDSLINSFNFTDKLVHIFLPIFDKKEINTWLTVDRLMSIGKVVVSRSNFDALTMEHILLENDVPIESSSWGIPEPIGGELVNASKLDYIIVPLLAFDKRGYRVGYGKGFYDSFFTNISPNAIKIGISFFDVEDKIEDVTELDIKLDYCLAPKNLYTFDK
jgi:5-formyltetrahydrofolate cyclo-ligase